jgi:tetratricopeptide (TPR) repeat protein
MPPGTQFPLVSGFARVERVLGRGGMGVVYLVHDDQLGRRAALKLTKGAPNPRRALRFQREVRVTAGLDHPNIPPVYEAGRTPDGQDYLLLRYVDGEPFSGLLEELHADAAAWQDDAATRRLVGILVKVCEAVDYAHRQGVVHRDLKPDNLMVGAFGEVLVMDWGLARILSEDAESDRKLRDDLGFADVSEGLTQQGAVLGTPGFMPPEQATGVDVDARADVFSLGAILCQALTGTLPFDATSGLEVLHRTMAGEIEIPADARKTLAPELTAICERALAPEPKDRYTGAGALADDLRAWLEGRPVSVYRYRPLEQALRLAKANPALFTGIGVAFVAVIVAALLVGRTRTTTLIEAEVAGLQEAQQASEVAWGRSHGASPELALDERVGLALSALQAAQRWRALAPEERAAAEAQFQAAVALGELAQGGEQWVLARQAFGEALGLQVADARVEVMLRQLEEAETSEVERKKAEVTAILDAVERGAYRNLPEGETDAVFQLVGYPGEQTVELLAESLTELTAKMLSGERSAYTSVATPNAREQQQGGGEIAAIGSAWDRRQAGEPLSPAQEEALRLAERRMVVRASPHANATLVGEDERGVTASIGKSLTLDEALANAQTSALSLGELDRLEVTCRALGRLGRSSVAVAGLGAYLAAERSLDRAALAGRSLCAMGGDEAVAAILRALVRWAEVHEFVDRIGPRLGDVLAGVDIRGAPADARRSVIQGLQRAGELEEALRAADRFLSDQPKDVRAHQLRAELLVTLRRYPAALRAVDRALELAPDDGHLWASRAWIHIAQGNQDLALKDATRSIEADPDLPDGWNARAEANSKLARWEEAGADVDKALELDPTFVDARTRRASQRLLLGDIQGGALDAERACKDAPWSLDAWVVLGRIRARQREFQGGVEALRRALEIDPSSAVALSDLGALRALMGETEAALVDARRALELDPQLASAWLNMAVVQRLRGDRDQTLRALEKAIALDPQRMEAWLVRGELLLNSGDPARALEDFDQAIKLMPWYGMGWNNRGMAKLQLGQIKPGLKDLDKAIELDPTLPEAWSNRGYAHLLLKQHDKARQDLERAVELAPTLALAWNNLSQARWEQKDREGAIEAQRRALELDPGLGIAHFNLGHMLFKVGRHEEALASLNEAIERSAGIARAWSDRAEVRLICGDPAGAIADLEEAKKRGVEVGQAVYVRGAAQGLLGDQTAGVKALKQYLKKYPRGRYVKEARAYVEQFQAELKAQQDGGS